MNEGQYVVLGDAPGLPAVFLEPAQGDRIRVRFFAILPRPEGFSVELGEDAAERVADVLTGKIDPWEFGPLTPCLHPQPADAIVARPSSNAIH